MKLNVNLFFKPMMIDNLRWNSFCKQYNLKRQSICEIEVTKEDTGRW